MTSTSQSGIACKTCRRRGRKCDRSLPKCMSCHRRGVECEGYALRWVGLAARGSMAGRTYQPATYDTAPRKEQASVSLVSKIDDAHVGCVLPQRLNATGVPEQDSYAHQYKYSSLANSTSRGGGTNLHLATSPRQPRWTMPAVLLTPDSVQVFVHYCKENSPSQNMGYHS